MFTHSVHLHDMAYLICSAVLVYSIPNGGPVAMVWGVRTIFLSCLVVSFFSTNSVFGDMKIAICALRCFISLFPSMLTRSDLYPAPFSGQSQASLSFVSDCPWQSLVPQHLLLVV